MADVEPVEPERGDLGATPLAELLARLDASGFSGSLELSLDHRVHCVVFEQGRVVKVQLAVPVEPLGRILVERGLIEAARLDALLESQPATGRQLGQLLVEQGLVEPAALDDALFEQARRRLLRLFLAGSGGYRLEPGRDALAARPALPRPFDPRAVLPEGVRHGMAEAELGSRLARALEGQVARVDLGDAAERLGFSPAEQSACRYLARGPWDASVFGAVPAAHKPTLLVAAYCLLATGRLVLSAASEAPPPPGEPSEPALGTPLRDEVLELRAGLGQMSFFDLLGVAETVSPEELKTRHLELVKRYHPDRAVQHGLAELKGQFVEILVAVNEAFETLNDPAARADYVARLHGPEGDGSSDVRDVVDRAVAAEHAYQLAVVLERRHRLDEAQRSADEALRLAPEQGEYICMSLWLTAARRSPRASVEDLVQPALEAAASVGRHERALMQAARLVQRAGRPSEAFELFRRVLAINPQNVDAAREVRLMEMRDARQAGSAGGLLGRLLGRKGR